MLLVDILFLLSLLLFPIILIFLIKLYKEKYIIEKMPKNYEYITNFSKDLIQYKNLEIKDYSNLLKFMKYILYNKLNKKLNNDGNIIYYKNIEEVLGKNFARKLKRFMIEIDNLRPFGNKAKLEKKLFSVIIEYNELISEING